MVGALVPFCGHIIIRDMSFARLVLFVALLTTTALPVLAQSADPIIAAVEAEDWQRARSEIEMEAVLPGRSGDGPRFDACQVHAAGAEAGQHVAEGAGPMRE